MKNNIKITACDNQLILLAVVTEASYELCNIQSGNFMPVSVEISLEAGEYSGPIHANGVNTPIDITKTVKLPAGTYTLLYSGINWGGPYNFNFTFNGESYKLVDDPKNPLFGVIWNKGDNSIQFTVS
jgi:hypothetical protein